MPKIPYKDNGFTLVELLVVISIIAILAVVGVVAFKNVTGGARDSRRKADIQSMAKAYEVKYQSAGSYQAVSDADFSQGKKPTDPLGGDYYNNRATDNSAYRVCAALDANAQRTCSAPSTNCYCASSAQGSYQAGSGGNGIPPDSPASCDPNGTLTTGLVGYWNFNENSGSILNDRSGSGNTGAWSGTGAHWTAGKLSSFGTAGNFSSANLDYVESPTSTSLTLNGTSESIFAWVKHNASDYIIFDGTWKRRLFGTRWTLVDNLNIYHHLYMNNGIDNNSWHLVGYVLGEGTVKAYIDDKGAVASESTAAIGPSNSYWWFGRLCGGISCDNYYTGQLDEVRIYNRALSDLEVSALYNNGNGCIPQ